MKAAQPKILSEMTRRLPQTQDRMCSILNCSTCLMPRFLMRFLHWAVNLRHVIASTKPSVRYDRLLTYTVFILTSLHLRIKRLSWRRTLAHILTLFNWDHNALISWSAYWFVRWRLCESRSCDSDMSWSSTGSWKRLRAGGEQRLYPVSVVISTSWNS